jgi:hypothetical protein
MRRAMTFHAALGALFPYRWNALQAERLFSWIQIIDEFERCRAPKADLVTLLLFEPTRQTAGTISRS